MLTVDVAIACYKDDPFLKEAIKSCEMQTLKPTLCIYHDDEGIGTGEAFNRAIAMGKSDIVVLLCSDDVFTDPHVISDIVAIFEKESIDHVSRWYHQFQWDRRPVRAWRSENILELANNPSGLAFRRLHMVTLSNKMFFESVDAVWRLCYFNPHGYQIMRWDTVAVRVHKSFSRNPEHYRKNWNGSLVEYWAKLGWKSNDYASLIQIKVNYTTKAVMNEILSFIKVNWMVLFNPLFWFFSFVVIITPRAILQKVPEIYRSTFGRIITREIKRK